MPLSVCVRCAKEATRRQLTRDDLDQIPAALPDVGAVVDDDDHARIDGEESGDALGSQTLNVWDVSSWS